MADSQSRENRAFACEIKALISVEQARDVRAWARARMQPDPNAESGAGDLYRITSLYYDTDDFAVFHRRGSFGRSKYRVRRYDSSERVFLERKLRNESIVTKRRTRVNIDELDRLRNRKPDVDWEGSWFQRRMLARGMNPACQIAYSRTALVSDTSAGLIRLTLDEDLRTWRVCQPEYVPVTGGTGTAERPGDRRTEIPAGDAGAVPGTAGRVRTEPAGGLQIPTGGQRPWLRAASPPGRQRVTPLLVP